MKEQGPGQSFNPEENEWFEKGEKKSDPVDDIEIEVVDEDEHGVKIPYRDQRDPVAEEMRRQQKQADRYRTEEKLALVKSQIEVADKPLPTNLREIFGFKKDEPIDMAALRREYKKLARIHHPDRGGNPDKMRAIQEAYDFLSTEGEVKEREQYVLARLFEMVGSGVPVGMETTTPDGKTVQAMVDKVDLKDGRITYSYSVGRWRRKQQGFFRLADEPSKLKALSKFVEQYTQQEREQKRAA